jgi:hypothetical protein
VEGCDARVTPNGRLAKHEVRSGEFDRITRAHAAEPARKPLWGGY